MDGTNDQVDHPKVHFVMVPFAAQGHTIPMLDLAMLLAARPGVLVTFVTTPVNAARIQHTIQRAKRLRLPINFHPLRFPSAEVGLPDGCENMDAIPSPSLAVNFFHALRMLREPLTKHLRLVRSHRRPPIPMCVVSDICNAWAVDVARDLGVPRLVFHAIGFFAWVCEHTVGSSGDVVRDDNLTEPFLVPGIPHRVEVCQATLQWLFPRGGGRFGPTWATLARELMEAEAAADGLVVNTAIGLEPDYAARFEEAKGKEKGMVWAIGPVSLGVSAEDAAARGDKSSVDADRVVGWLDGQEPGSVVYVSLGNLERTSMEQLVEIGLGMEAAGVPFVWVVKVGEKVAEVEEWMASSGFLERVGGRCHVIMGWAPQLAILSHPSVGGFVTHCGWNSTLEGVSAGVPMVTWPRADDQFLNERFVVDVLRVGVGVKLPTWWAEAPAVSVRRGELAVAVQEVMGEGEEGVERRRRAREWKEVVRKEMGLGGASRLAMDQMVEDVLRCYSTKYGSDADEI